jgi:GGDEF domain-containing protein
MQLTSTLTIAEHSIMADLNPDELRALIHNASLGVLSSAALAIALQRTPLPRDLVYLDLDNLHDLNTALGHMRVNELLRPALQVRSTDAVAGRVAEGDELVILAPVEQGLALARRVLHAIQHAPLTTDERVRLLDTTGGRVLAPSATLAVVERADDLAQALARAERAVECQKRLGQRGCIVVSVAE